MMLDAHSEALQNSTCCRPWVPGWCHPSVHLQSQRYLASIAWCQMILAHVLDFLCTDWNQCSFMLSIDCAASFYLLHGTRLFEQFVEDKGIKLLNSESRYLWLILCLPCDDFVRCCYTSFWYPLPWSNNFAAFFAWTHTCSMILQR